MYVLLNAVFFRDMDQGFEVNIDIIFVLCSGIIDQNIDVLDVRKFFIITDIALIITILSILDACCLAVNSDNIMAFF